MKKLILVIAILVSWQPLLAQVHGDSTSEKTNIYRSGPRHGTPPFSYIGFSTGINNPAGYAGFDFDIPISTYVTIGAGGGISTWGNKFHLDGKYFLKPYQRGWAIGGGLTINSGDNNFQTRNLMTVAGEKEMVYLNLHAQRNLFLAIYHYWDMGRRYNRFFMEAGWSVATVDHKFNQTSGDRLTQSSADKIDRLSPGGFIIGCGVSFGLHH